MPDTSRSHTNGLNKVINISIGVAINKESVSGCLKEIHFGSCSPSNTWKYVTNINEISDTEIQALEYAIFTNSTPSGKTIEFSLEEKDVFYDAFVADSKDGVMLSDDYITPHGENPLKDPKPILFLKIRPDVTINFYFKLCTTHLYKEKVCSSKQIEEIKKTK